MLFNISIFLGNNTKCRRCWSFLYENCIWQSKC